MVQVECGQDHSTWILYETTLKGGNPYEKNQFEIVKKTLKRETKLKTRTKSASVVVGTSISALKSPCALVKRLGLPCLPNILVVLDAFNQLYLLISYA